MERPAANEPEAKKQKVSGLDGDTNKFRIEGLQEEEKRGMRSFLGDRSVFFAGIIKQRFEDFHVHEVDLDKNVVRITSQEIFDTSNIDKDGNINVLEVQSDEQLKNEFISLLGEEKTNELL